MCPSDFVIHAGLATQSDDLTADVIGSVRPTSILPRSPPSFSTSRYISGVGRLITHFG
jgi:hypothetical protein